MQTGPPDGDQTAFTCCSPDYPDFPMPQLLDNVTDERRVVVSCLISDLLFEWRLEPLDPAATRISVHVEIPEQETQRLATQRDLIGRSLRKLARIAADG